MCHLDEMKILYFNGLFLLVSKLDQKIFSIIGVFPIHVICLSFWTGTRKELMIETYRFMNTIKPIGCDIRTEFKPISSSTEQIGERIIIKELVFDGEIVAYCKKFDEE